MTRSELIAACSLAGVYFLRMLGLFVVLPAYALHAHELSGATDTLIGVAVGVYGGTQALLQIPFGRWSDRYGRKPIIIGGLLLFILGSLLAASASDIYTSIAGRALQGAGAVSAAIMALAADLTREEIRTRVMAIIGISIGMSFALAFVIGPLVATVAGLAGLFSFAALLGVLAIVLMVWAVPNPPAMKAAAHGVAGRDLHRALADPNLIRLNLGIFCLHALLTATFVVLPLVLRDRAGLPASAHWQLYLPALLLSVACVMPLVRRADRGREGQRLFLASILGLATVELLLAGYQGGTLLAGLLLLMFFLAFNLLEAGLPALVSRAAPGEIRGTALGLYATTQFLGTFLGGVLAGLVHEHVGLNAVFLMNAAIAGAWAWSSVGLSLPAMSAAPREVEPVALASGPGTSGPGRD